MSIPVHLSREASPGERGRVFGRDNADAVANTVAAYRRLFGEALALQVSDIRQIGTGVGERLSARWPELVEEIGGIAQGAGQDEAELLAFNARTEIVGGAMPSECSTICALPQATADGSLLLAQNWDWHPDARASRVIWSVVEPSGHWWTTLTEAGILAKIGLNSAGLGVCLNFLQTSADGGVTGTPIHILLRLLLQRCADIYAAFDLFQMVQLSSSSCITLGYWSPLESSAAAIELSPGGPQVIWPDERGRLIHTNHFLQPPPRGDDLGADMPNTTERWAELKSCLAAQEGPVSLEDVRRMLSSHGNDPNSVCCHLDINPDYLLRAATLASVIMDLRGPRLLVTDGAPCIAPYDNIPLPVPVAR